MDTLKNKELILIYNEKNNRGKQTLALAQSLTDHIDRKEIHNTKITETLIKHALFSLQLQPKDIINKSSEIYQETLKGRDFDDRSWTSILAHNLSLLKAPIAIFGTKAVLCTSPTDILKLKTR